MKIYTKGGDGGETSLFDGERVAKSHRRVAAYGDVDELNACLGVARSEMADEPRLADIDEALAAVQCDLFALGAVLADPRRDADKSGALARVQVPFDEGRAAELEVAIDRWEAELPPLTNFILPGGSRPAAALHVARTVSRRAERNVVDLLAAGAGHPCAIVYLNRLSDFLFVASRVANHRLGSAEIIWSARS